jgi:hypothetical protein
MPKWYDVAEKNLEAGDEIVSNWSGQYNEHDGHIVFSKEKILFVEEKGFINRTADVLLEIPYEKIAKINTDDVSQLVLTKSDGKNYSIETRFLSNVKEALQDLTK